MKYTLKNNPTLKTFAFVEARQITEETFDEVASWAEVEECWGTNCPDRALLGMTGCDGETRHAYLSDYVVKTGPRFVVMQRDLFEYLYETLLSRPPGK